MRLPFFTVGHSDRTIERFTATLEEARVERVVDVRKLPGSRRHPQFDRDALRDALSGDGIRYERVAALGGRRPRSKGVPPDVNGFWENRSFHNYADYALSPGFREGLEQLLRLGRESRVAVMCSEAVWWRCHRRIIADHLLARGEEVRHILAPGRIDPAELTPGAVVHADRSVTYPARPDSG